MDPYKPPQTNKKKNQKPKIHQIHQINQQILTNIYEKTRYYKKFFTIKAKNEQSLAEIPTIAANRDLQRIIKGIPAKTTELRDGSLLVEVANEPQSQNILNIKKLADTEVLVAPHANLNQIKGTIRYDNKPKYTTEQILEDLKDQKVSDVYNIQRRSNNALVNTNIYIVTFEACQLPDYVEIGWTKCLVREYIPRPRRCYGCQKFGHGRGKCRGQDTCPRCGLAAHEDTCDREPKCANCEGDHPASSRDCFYYQLEQETLTYQTRNRLSYGEAKGVIRQKYLKPVTSYASVVQNQPKQRLPYSQPTTRQSEYKPRNTHPTRDNHSELKENVPTASSMEITRTKDKTRPSKSNEPLNTNAETQENQKGKKPSREEPCPISTIITRGNFTGGKRHHEDGDSQEDRDPKKHLSSAPSLLPPTPLPSKSGGSSGESRVKDQSKLRPSRSNSASDRRGPKDTKPNNT